MNYESKACRLHCLTLTRKGREQCRIKGGLCKLAAMDVLRMMREAKKRKAREEGEGSEV